MSRLPKEIKLTKHAQQRLEERKAPDNYYNTKNLMKSSCKWYTKNDLIPRSQLYLHCLYVCRKSNQMGYITDGNIEVIYNKGTGIAITVMEVKEKFLPITQFIRPEILDVIKRKKEIKKMRKKSEIIIGTCPDCAKDHIEITTQGVCPKCRTRRTNAKSRKKEYVPYINLSLSERNRIDALQSSQAKRKLSKKEETIIKEIPMPKIETAENYYQVKATQNPAIAHAAKEIKETPGAKVVIPHTTIIDPLSDPTSFVMTLRECGCEIPEETLKDVLDVLVSTDKLKDIFMTIANADSQDAILNLEQALNVVERKLQHNWEFNGFQEIDDIKFKGFLTWRRVLKGAIFFWKKLYQTNALIEMQRAWNAYTSDPNDKILLMGDRINTTQKRFQITTESISTIFNTKRPFTRVFYATSQDDAYDKFIKWMADRQLHEDKSKTVIKELTSEDGGYKNENE